jgi:hypothetical protein
MGCWKLSPLREQACCVGLGWEQERLDGAARGAESAGFVGGEVGEGFSHPLLAAELEAELGRVGGAGVELRFQGLEDVRRRLRP